MNVQFYRLGCNMDISAARLSYHTLAGCPQDEVERTI